MHITCVPFCYAIVVVTTKVCDDIDQFHGGVTMEQSWYP